MPATAVAPLEPTARRLAEPALHALHARYRASGDRRLRDQLVLSLSPLVKHIAFRQVRSMPTHVDVDDFISCGLEALIAAIDRFDPAKSPNLTTYCWTRVHGAVLDELRRQDWAPRSVRRLERQIAKARREFLAIHGREADIQETADMLGVDVATLHKHRVDLVRAEPGSLNETVQDTDGTVEVVEQLHSSDRDCDPEASAAMGDARARFRQAFAELPERERTVAVLLYVKELTLSEIGDVLGVSESRVCQIHGELRRTLRARLGQDFRELLAA